MEGSLDLRAWFYVEVCFYSKSNSKCFIRRNKPLISRTRRNKYEAWKGSAKKYVFAIS